MNPFLISVEFAIQTLRRFVIILGIVVFSWFNSIAQSHPEIYITNDQKTGIWPEVAGYNMLVGNDMLEIFCLMDNTLNNNLVKKISINEKANLAIFQYLFPNGYTVAYGDSKNSRIRFNALEMLISQYRKYENSEKENPGFVGIHVVSNNNHHDFFYNDENQESESKFNSGSFQGRIGIYSLEGKAFKSILLHDGKHVDAGFFIIKIPEKRGNVLIKQIPNGFEIDASQAFKLTIPAPAYAKEAVSLQSVNSKEKKSFTGKVFKKDKINVAEFDLPALTRVQLKLNSYN